MSTDEHCEILCLDLEVAEAIRADLPNGKATDAAANMSKAFSDPVRIQIGTALSHANELCGCDLSWILGRSQALVSHHLRLMKSSGAVDSRKVGRIVLYSFTPAGRAVFEVLGQSLVKVGG